MLFRDSWTIFGFTAHPPHRGSTTILNKTPGRAREKTLLSAAKNQPKGNPNNQGRKNRELCSLPLSFILITSVIVAGVYKWWHAMREEEGVFREVSGPQELSCFLGFQRRLSAPQRCNAERSDAQRKFFTTLSIPLILQRHRCDALPCFSASPVVIFYIAHIALRPLLPFFLSPQWFTVQNNKKFAKSHNAAMSPLATRDGHRKRKRKRSDAVH